ncbi:hypothetical protein STEG23_012830, partial [Scotinomys teguina]
QQPGGLSAPRGHRMPGPGIAAKSGGTFRLGKAHTTYNKSISKALVAYYQKYVDEASKKEIKDILIQYDRTLLVADPRRCESKKFGGPVPVLNTRNPTDNPSR